MEMIDRIQFAAIPLDVARLSFLVGTDERPASEEDIKDMGSVVSEAMAAAPLSAGVQIDALFGHHMTRANACLIVKRSAVTSVNHAVAMSLAILPIVDHIPVLLVGSDDYPACQDDITYYQKELQGLLGTGAGTWIITHHALEILYAPRWT